jgi:hypothetical protein
MAKAKLWLLTVNGHIQCYFNQNTGILRRKEDHLIAARFKIEDFSDILYEFNENEQSEQINKTKELWLVHTGVKIKSLKIGYI